MQQLKRLASMQSNYVFLIILLLLQFLLCLHFGNEKAGFHVDEVATYELSNSPDGIWPTWGINQWRSGEEYKNSFLINQNTRFSYTMVYENQEKDVHPPLYYMIIHTISSFVPGIFSKWIGLIPNIVFSILTTIVVWNISTKLIQNNIVALATAGFYAFSVGTFSTVTFIRMYAMMALFCSLLVLIHVNLACKLLYHKEILKKDYLLLLLCTTAGILTQYYFMIFCFFLCGCFAIGLFLLKKWRQLFIYIGAEFGAILISLLIFPKMLYHCFEGYRGKEALANAAHSEQAIESLKKVVSIISKQVGNGWLWELGILILGVLLLFLVNYFFLHIKVSFDSKDFRIFCNADIFLKRKITYIVPYKIFIYLTFVLVITGYLLLVSRIAPFQTDRYYMCLYPLIYIVLAHVFFFLIQHVFKSISAAYILSIFLLLICTAGHLQQEVNYIYKNYKQRVTLHEYADLPVIVINGTYNEYANYWIYEYMEHPAVFRTEGYFELSKLSKYLNNHNLSGSFLIYACGLNMNEDELFNEIAKYINVDSHEQIVWAGDPVYLCNISAQ